MSRKASLSIRPAVPADIPTMVDIFLDAFSTNKIGQTFFPHDSPAVHRFWTSTLTQELDDPHAHFLLVGDSNSSSEAASSSESTAIAIPIAFAKWVAPLASPAPPPPTEESQWPAQGARAAVFFAHLASMHDEIMAQRPHWYLEMLVTRTACQGRGAGALCMEWGVARAQADGAPCYLDATPEGKGLYVRFGFEEVAAGEWGFFDGGYRHSFMVREKLGDGWNIEEDPRK